MADDRVGYTREAAAEYRRAKPWTVTGLDISRLGTIRKDLPSKPGTAMVQWDGSSQPQQIASDFLEER
jgi:hypothetical protein